MARLLRSSFISTQLPVSFLSVLALGAASDIFVSLWRKSPQRLNVLKPPSHSDSLPARRSPWSRMPQEVPLMYLRRHCCDLWSPIIATFPSYAFAYVTVLFEWARCCYVELDLPVCVWDRERGNLCWLLITVFGWMDRQMCRKLKTYEPKWLAVNKAVSCIYRSFVGLVDANLSIFDHPTQIWPLLLLRRGFLWASMQFFFFTLTVFGMHTRVSRLWVSAINHDWSAISTGGVKMFISPTFHRSILTPIF